MPSHNRLSDELVARMHADYVRLGSLVRAAALHGRCGATLLQLFRSRGLPMLGNRGERVAATRRSHLDGLVAQMHAEYLGGASLNQLGAKYGRDRRNVAGLFVSRGLALRPAPAMPRDPQTGRIIPAKPHTEAEIDALIRGLRRLIVPAALRKEWREWPMARRLDFIARARKHLASPHDQPQTPCSANVEPFAYGSPRAHAIADRENAGRNSRDWRIHLKISSQGVIWRNQLFFWCPDKGLAGGAYYTGIWQPGIGRPALHHIIWEESHGAVPPGHVVRMRDGNPNNLDPGNLVCVPRDAVCRENQSKALFRKSRERTALLLARAQTPRTKNDDLLASLAR
jgi:hypothetical protein